MLRSLRPFKRRWTQGQRDELDIDGTVQAYARTWRLIPQFRAAPERWFEADVVIDDSPSMAVWAGATARLTATLEQLGAFRTVRTWWISVTGAAPELFNKGRRPSGPGQLRSPDGRRLIIIVSDGAASGWSRPEMWRLMRTWAESTPTVLISPLPTRLWSRTGLGLPAVRVGPGAPGSPNRRLRYSVPIMLRLGADTRPGWLPIPAATFSAHMLGQWARTLMKGDPRGCPALLAPATWFPREVTVDYGGSGDRSRFAGGQLVDAFRRTASPAAARLAVLCAPFSALSVPLLELLAQELVEDCTPGDLAEVIVGGLFRPAAAEPGRHAAGAVLRFRPGVRERLREILSEADAWRTHKAISSHIANTSGLANTFAVGFPDPDGDIALPDVLWPFAAASLEVLTFLDALPAVNAPVEPLITVSPPAPESRGPIQSLGIAVGEDGMPEKPEPVLLRMLVGGELRRLREAAGISAEKAGYEIRGSRSKIARMETGRVGFKLRDIEDLLALYGVDERQREKVLALARRSQEPEWWRQYHDILPDWFETYLGLESTATSIRSFDMEFVPGLFQTEAYARAVARLGHQAAPAQEIERRVGLRLKRQELLARRQPPRMWTVMDEAVLRRPVGGASVMRTQLGRLVEVAQLPYVTLQVMPFARGAHAAASGSFSILRFEERDLPDVVYMEQLTSAVYLDQRPDVEHYVEVIDQLSVEALTPADTIRFIEQVTREL
jgi:transcriptional regulator with XRE-family HTH domain